MTQGRLRTSDLKESGVRLLVNSDSSVGNGCMSGEDSSAVKGSTVNRRNSCSDSATNSDSSSSVCY